MRYRSLGNTGIESSLLGFGCMRLPTIGGGPQDPIDRGEAIRLIRHAIDQGVTYIDTAYPYHGGESEVVVGQALREGYRERITLATKLPVWMVEQPDDFDRLFSEQLQRLDLDHVDLYLMHALDRPSYHDKVLGMGLLDRAKKARDEGRIKHLAFSFHDEPEVLQEIIDSGEFEAMLVQYNLLDRANEEMIEYAAGKGLGVVVMSPVGGGMLADPPEEVRGLLPTEETSTAELAFRFVYANPNVHCALSGMGSMEMVRQNLAVAGTEPGLTDLERSSIEGIVKRYQGMCDLYCTSCGYCMPCESGVNIPLVFQMVNTAKVFRAPGLAKEKYSMIGEVSLYPGKTASACTECGDCLEKCPQDVPVIDRLREARELFGK